MSLKITSYVWENSKEKGSALLMLLAIADSANDEGYGFPKVETLAKKARVTIRSAQRMLDRLEADGEIIIFNRVNPDEEQQHYSNVYQIPVPGSDQVQPQIKGKLKRRVFVQNLNDSDGVVTPVSLPLINASGSREETGGGSDAGVIRVVTPVSSELSTYELSTLKDSIAPKNGAMAQDPMPDPLPAQMELFQSADPVPKTTPASDKPAPKPRPANPWYDVVQEVWGYTASLNGEMANMLRGCAKRNGYKEFNLEPGLTPHDIREWADWYRQAHKNGKSDPIMAARPILVQSSITAWREGRHSVPTVLDGLKIVTATYEEVYGNN